MIKISMGPESPQQVFTLANPHHMLMKLAWEKNNLKAAIDARNTQQEHDFKNHHAAAYFAFNFAVTAWCIADWVWETADDDWRDLVCISLDCKKDYQKFIDALLRRHRPLRICQQIANGSKHMKLRNPDPSVRVDASSKYVPALAGKARVGDSLGRFDFDLIIWDDGNERKAVDVFEEAFDTWEFLLSSWFFIEGRAIFPDELDKDEKLR
jgi:hypothetical protein